MNDEVEEVIGRLDELIDAVGRASYDGITAKMAKELLSKLEKENRDLTIQVEDMLEGRVNYNW